MKKYLLTLLLPLFVSATGFAAEGGGGYASLIVGLSVPDSSNTIPHGIYGFSGGSQINKIISLGGYHAVSSTENGPGNSPFEYSLTGLEARVNMGSADSNVFVGLRGGITKVNSSSAGTDLTFSPYHYGLVYGYNFRIWKVISIGLEGSYLEIEEASALSGATVVDYKPFHTINFFGTFGVMF